MSTSTALTSPHSPAASSSRCSGSSSSNFNNNESNSTNEALRTFRLLITRLMEVGLPLEQEACLETETLSRELMPSNTLN